jgi:hypothetical protein
MGAFPNHGVEYMIEFSTEVDENVLYSLIQRVIYDVRVELAYTQECYINSCGKRLLVLIPQTMADKRLLESNYYKERQDKWFASDVVARDFIKKIEQPPGFLPVVDIELSKEEKEVIEFVLHREELRPYIINNGWYEVNVVFSTM